MLITTILQFVRYIQSFAILSILAYLVMLKSSSFLAIPHSTSDFSVYAVDTYPFLWIIIRVVNSNMAQLVAHKF